MPDMSLATAGHVVSPSVLPTPKLGVYAIIGGLISKDSNTTGHRPRGLQGQCTMLLLLLPPPPLPLPPL
jgi:hypothetical protein